jgi:hypothetical protein
MKVSQYPGMPSGSQLAEADRLSKVLFEVTTNFELLLSTEVGNLNTALSRADQALIEWESEESFLSAEGKSGASGSGQIDWKGNEFYRQLNSTSLGWRWVMLW